MTKKELALNLRNFKVATIGAACYRKPSGDPFCANGLTLDQAKEFGQKHGLTLINWSAGKSCSQVNCQ